MILDKATRIAIQSAVKQAAIDMNEVYTEKWLTGQKLCEELPFFTKDWLKHYGSTLPRECVRVTDTEGNQHRTSWCYPYKRILRMIANGECRELKYQE